MTVWWQSRETLLRFQRWVHARAPQTPEQLLAIQAEPWLHTRAYREMLREEDAGDLSMNLALLRRSVVKARERRVT